MGSDAIQEAGSGTRGREQAADEAREAQLSMIELTRLNGSRFSVNCDLIKYIEAAPDTLLTLITGDKLLVRETIETVAERTVEFRSKVLFMAWPDAQTALSAKAGREAYAATHTKQDNFSGSST
jgi:flagellar protein FlbD